MSDFQNIEATDYSPNVLFEETGLVNMQGELRTSNPEAFFVTVQECLSENLKKISNNKFTIHFRFTYIGSSNASELFKFITSLHKETDLVWKFDNYDDDIKELGEIIKMGYAPNLVLEEL